MDLDVVFAAEVEHAHVDDEVDQYCEREGDEKVGCGHDWGTGKERRQVW